MKPILIKIANILSTIPKMDKTRMIGIMNPIDTISQANNLLSFLEKNKDNSEVMNVSYLLRYNHEIIGN